MNWIKRNVFFAAGGLTALILMGLAGWYVFAGVRKNAAMTEKLNEAEHKFKQLWSSKIFPGSENIAAAEADKKRQEAFKVQLEKFFQPVPYKKYKSDQLYEAVHSMVGDLHQLAEDQGVEVAPGFSFSFSAQQSSEVRNPEEINLVASQLEEIRVLCRLLFEAKITALHTLRRAKVSVQDGQASSSAEYLEIGSETNKAANALVMPYEVSFDAFGKNLGQVLTALKKSPHGFVVTSITIKPPATSRFRASATSLEMDSLFGRLTRQPATPIMGQIPNVRDLDRLRRERNLGGAAGGTPPPRIGIFPAASPAGPAGKNDNPLIYRPVMDEEAVTVTLKLGVVRFNK